MRSLDGLSLDQLGRWAHVGAFSASDVDYRGGVAGAPPVFRPRTYEDPGTGGPGLFLQILGKVTEQDLGASLQVRPRQPVSRGGYPFTATQGYLTRAPGNFPVPPAWKVKVSPDEELRMGSPARGTY